MTSEFTLLNEWCEKDSIDKSKVEFEGYQKFDKTILGYTSVYMGTTFIHIQLVLKQTNFAKYGVLWHEYCHCYDYIKNGNLGHTSKWWSKFITKPQYVFLSGVAQIVYKFIKD